MSRRDPRLTLAQIREAAKRALLLCASPSLEEHAKIPSSERS
jgi:hypothetical protein